MRWAIHAAAVCRPPYVQNHQAKVSVVPSVAVLVIKALKDLQQEITDGEFEYATANSPLVKLGMSRTQACLCSELTRMLDWLLPMADFSLREYYTSMYIENTQRPYFLAIDFGSVFTWLQCDAPCTNCAKVDSFFRSSIPGIFAIGDVAAFPPKMYDIVCMPNIHFKSLYRCRCQSKVWAIADSKRQGYLGFGQFVTAMQVFSSSPLCLSVILQSGMEKWGGGGGSETSLACIRCGKPTSLHPLRPYTISKMRVVPDEIEKPDWALDVAREVLDAAARVIKPGITTDEIDRVVPEETIDRGARQRKNSEWRWQRSGEFGTRIWLAC
ncbi:hypothetical protein ABZP36_026266 [Zizania latifolia]